MGQFVGGLVTFFIIMVAIIQAIAPIIQSISKANEKSTQPPGTNLRGPRNAERDVPPQASFLPELTQQGRPRPASTASLPQPNSRSQNPLRGQQGRQKQKPAKSSKSDSTASRAGKSPPGSGVGAHVEAYIGQHVKSHIGKQIGDAVKTDISDQVRSHLGDDRNSQSATTSTTHGSSAAAELLRALRSPEGVRQAILISEVLSKPKALRRP